MEKGEGIHKILNLSRCCTKCRFMPWNAGRQPIYRTTVPWERF